MKSSTLLLPLVIGLSYCLPLQTLSAVILYSGSNTENLTAPDAEREDLFNAVGYICKFDGTSRTGSVVYLGGKYVLTADHVVIRDKVSFDGSTFYNIDKDFGGGGGSQVLSTDLKVVKLIAEPTGLVPVVLNTSSLELNKAGTIVACGRGVDPADTNGADGWDFGNPSTENKRWGTNDIAGNLLYTYEVFKKTYTNVISLNTILNNNEGDDEAGLNLIDSGGAIFGKFGAGPNQEWRLMGVPAVVFADPAPFSNSPTLDNQNLFVRISSYASAIQDEIPDTSVYADWKVDHSLYGADALDDADTDGDSIGQLQEFAFGGDPHLSDVSILPALALVEDDGSTYLELAVTRPIGLQDITYTPKTTTDLSSWPSDSSGIVDDSPTPVDNLDGTETLTYRRSGAVASVEAAFMRVDVSETP